MSALERHVADVCPRCSGKRYVTVKVGTPNRQMQLPAGCTDKGTCERELTELVNA